MDDRKAADALDRVLDRMADVGGGDTLVPELAQIACRYQAIGQSPAPVSARERVRRRIATDGERSLHGGDARSAMGRNGRGPSRRTQLSMPTLDRAASSGRSFGVGFLAPTVLLLVGSAVAMVAAGLLLRHGDERAGVPAVVPAFPYDPVALVWSTTGGPDDPLDDPTYPAFDANGNLWVPDGRNGQFQIFAPDGTLLEVWGISGNAQGQFNFMEAGFGGYGQGSVTFDADGNFYVVDTGNYRVQKFGPDRQFLTAWGVKGSGDGQFEGALDIAVDGEGRVFVVDAARGDLPDEAAAIQAFDSDGQFLAAWGAHGSGDGQLIDPSGLAIDGDGDVWVADFGNNRVQQFTPDGTFLTGWGGPGSGPGQFFNPTDVAIDEHGRVWVSDWRNGRVQVFEPDGTFVAAWGDEHTFGEGRLMGPNSLVLDGDGFVYVADINGDTVQKFRLLPPLAPA